MPETADASQFSLQDIHVDIPIPQLPGTCLRLRGQEAAGFINNLPESEYIRKKVQDLGIDLGGTTVVEGDCNFLSYITDVCTRQDGSASPVRSGVVRSDGIFISAGPRKFFNHGLHNLRLGEDDCGELPGRDNINVREAQAHGLTPGDIIIYIQGKLAVVQAEGGSLKLFLPQGGTEQTVDVESGQAAVIERNGPDDHRLVDVYFKDENGTVQSLEGNAVPLEELNMLPIYPIQNIESITRTIAPVNHGAVQSALIASSTNDGGVTMHDAALLDQAPSVSRSTGVPKTHGEGCNFATVTGQFGSVTFVLLLGIVVGAVIAVRNKDTVDVSRVSFITMPNASPKLFAKASARAIRNLRNVETGNPWLPETARRKKDGGKGPHGHAGSPTRDRKKRR